MLALLFLQYLHAQVDKDALPKVEEGFKINFFVKEPHIINPSSLFLNFSRYFYTSMLMTFLIPPRLLDETASVSNGVAFRAETYYMVRRIGWPVVAQITIVYRDIQDRA